MFLVLFALAALAWLLVACWGPGNHLEFEARVWRRRKELLPTEVRRLIESQRPAWQYGHIAADIITFKAFGGHYNHCHRWTIVSEMRALAKSDAEQAFALGYLAHLAADTIAHNHFVPYHLARYSRGAQLGHLYWEMNADRFVPAERWEAVKDLKSRDELTALDELVNSTVPRKALSMGTNKMIFNHVLLVSARTNWRHSIERLHPRRHLRLERRFLELFQHAAVDRIQLALKKNGLRQLANIDTNGKDAQKQALEAHASAVRRHPSGKDRDTELELAAVCFLDGMQSPPPREQGLAAVWTEG